MKPIIIEVHPAQIHSIIDALVRRIEDNLQELAIARDIIAKERDRVQELEADFDEAGEGLAAARERIAELEGQLKLKAQPIPTVHWQAGDAPEPRTVCPPETFKVNVPRTYPAGYRPPGVVKFDGDEVKRPEPTPPHEQPNTVEGWVEYIKRAPGDFVRHPNGPIRHKSHDPYGFYLACDCKEFVRVWPFPTIADPSEVTDPALLAAVQRIPQREG